MSYFAAALARTSDGWTANEVDLEDVESIDDVVDLLRDLAEDADPALLVLEEDDEYVAIVRLDRDEDDPRIFLSDGRATDTFAIAELLADGIAAGVGRDDDEEDSDDEDEDEDEDSPGHDSEPVGDASLLTDLGTSTGQLLELCVHEGTLPSDVISTVCEQAGCLDELEALRDEVA